MAANSDAQECNVVPKPCSRQAVPGWSSWPLEPVCPLLRGREDRAAVASSPAVTFGLLSSKLQCSEHGSIPDRHEGGSPGRGRERRPH